MKDGTKRPKGQARRQRTMNQRSRDNALGLFRQLLQEKASRSKMPKRVVFVSEQNSFAARGHRCPRPQKGEKGEKNKGKVIPTHTGSHYRCTGSMDRRGHGARPGRTWDH